MGRRHRPLLVCVAAACLVAACDESESCRPQCRPTADGRDIEVILPCQPATFTVQSTCSDEFNRAPCEDVLFHRCEVREYSTGRTYRICVTEAFRSSLKRANTCMARKLSTVTAEVFLMIPYITFLSA